MINAFLLLASVAPQVTYVGKFDPASFPLAQKTPRVLPQPILNRTVEQVLASGQCRIPGQDKLRFNFAVPYAVLLDSSGQAKKVVVKEIACPPVESRVGQVAVKISERGDFKAQHATGERWYLGEVSFAQGGDWIVSARGDPDKVVCKTKAVTGTRTATIKDCRTNAEWRAYAVDRDFQTRELQKWHSPVMDD